MERLVNACTVYIVNHRRLVNAVQYIRTNKTSQTPQRETWTI